MPPRKVTIPEPNPAGLCLCGCGGKTPLAKRSSVARGHVRGRPIRFIPGHQRHVLDRYDIDPETGCWNWKLAVQKGRGYGVVSEGHRQFPAYRWMYERLVGPIPEGHDLHHVCRNRRCVNPDHLQPVTKLEHNRLSPQCKMTPETVREIRRLAESGTMLHREIAALFDLSQGRVTNIINRKCWKDVA